ncbi:unknown similar to AMEV183 [Mythimna separata entomopoxvirus 'L']|uniref:Uncharacterized protein n=1 Tax=Mythimna separata entomopoxvirus 'L' TaxID=1293572 RepID=A0A916KQC4_9POXV|nr:unknown similar to AMEV183 [Mythimna separata entomopoxvirus 'L']CCU56416.1 unknown similar to AMEV183 [Mythimna separata entomopoxvirus 'L']
MFLIYFNTFLILILFGAILCLYILLFFYNIDFLINNNKRYILSYNAININNINDLSLISTYSDIIFLSNLNINNPYNVSITNNLQEIPLYPINNNISNQYRFYSARNNNINILLAIRNNLNITNPFLYFRNTTISIIVNNEETYHCYIGLNENSNILDIIAPIEYVTARYKNYVIIGEIPNKNIQFNTILNKYIIITNKKIINKYSAILSFLNSNIGTVYVINQ